MGGIVSDDDEVCQMIADADLVVKINEQYLLEFRRRHFNNLSIF